MDVLKAQLQNATLQNQILQQSIENERLRRLQEQQMTSGVANGSAVSDAKLTGTIVSNGGSAKLSTGNEANPLASTALGDGAATFESSDSGNQITASHSDPAVAQLMIDNLAQSSHLPVSHGSDLKPSANISGVIPSLDSSSSEHQIGSVDASGSNKKTTPVAPIIEANLAYSSARYAKSGKEPLQTGL